jgi:putative peptide zinc metalloprotease protein
MQMLQLRPTFSESWYRVKDLRPKLRAGAQISRQYYRGDRWYVVRDPAGNQFHRLSDAAYRFVGLLDGTRTVGEAWDLVGGTLEDDAPTQPEVIQILSQLYSANLVETDIPPDASVLLRRHKVQQKRMMQGRLMNVLFPRIPLWDPDRFLVRWMPVVGPMLSKWGAIVWLLFVGAAIAVVAPKYGVLQADFMRALDMSGQPSQWLIFLAVFWVIKFIHECGHAFFCRRFGGEVHEMGIMFLVFVPTPYVDASTAWAFPSRWARMAVGAGGMIFELFIAAIAAFVWAGTSPGVPVWGIDLHGLTSYVIFIASITTIIFNANPLLRYDGYYMLSDFLEIPNLQMKSREYMMGLIKRHIWRLKLQQPLPPPVQRVELLVYGILSTIYRIFVGIMIILMVLYTIPILGVLMAIGGVITWLVVPWFKLFKYLTIEPELHRKRGRAWVTVGVLGALAVILLGLINFPVNVYAEGIADPQQRATLVARTPGFVEKIVAHPGQKLSKGDTILVGRDDELETRIRQAQANIERMEIHRKQAGAVDQAQRRIAEEQIKAMAEQLSELNRQKDDLTIKAPIDGHLIAPKLYEMDGKFLQKGEEIGTVATLDRLEIHAVIDQTDAQLAHGIDLNEKAIVRLVGWPGKDLKPDEIHVTYAALEKLWNPAMTLAGGGTIQSDPRDPRGVTPLVPQFELRCAFSNPIMKDADEAFREIARPFFQPGQRAYVKLKLDHKPLAWQWMRKFKQLIMARRAEKNPLTEGM